MVTLITLHPILSTTARRACYGDVRYQLTGPAIRNDSRTLATHRRMLLDHKDFLSLYDQLSNILVSLKATLPQQ